MPSRISKRFGNRSSMDLSKGIWETCCYFLKLHYVVCILTKLQSCLGLRSKGWSQQGSFILPTISCQIRIHHHLKVSLGYLKSWLISKKLTFPTICWILKVKVQFNCFKHKYYKRELKLFNCLKELMKLCMIVSRFFHVWEEFHLTTIQ